MADGSLHALSICAETEYGVTPATPGFDMGRITGTTLGLSKATLESDEIRSDRQVAAVKHGAKQVGGEITGELSYGTWDNFLASLFGSTWIADELKAGVLRSSYSILREFTDLTAGDNFHLYTGVEINTLAMEVTPEAIVTVNWGIVGQDLTTDTAGPAGMVQTPANTNTVIDAFTGTVQEGGSEIGVVTAINFTMENGIEPRFVVGRTTTIRPAIGRFRVSGELTAYFEDGSLLSKFIDEVDTSIVLALTDLDANTYTITIPKVVLTGGQPDVTSEGPITLTMPFVAVYDETAVSNIVITRA